MLLNAGSGLDRDLKPVHATLPSGRFEIDFHAWSAASLFRSRTAVFRLGIISQCLFSAITREVEVNPLSRARRSRAPHREPLPPSPPAWRCHKAWKGVRPKWCINGKKGCVQIVENIWDWVAFENLLKSEFEDKRMNPLRWCLEVNEKKVEEEQVWRLYSVRERKARTMTSYRKTYSFYILFF